MSQSPWPSCRKLVRMLTGFESTFSRSGEYFVAEFAVPDAGARGLLDGVRPVSAGGVLRALLPGRVAGDGRGPACRLAPAAPRVRVAAVLALLALAPNGVAAISPKDLENSVQRTMQSHEYDWRLPPEPGATAQKSWLVAHHRPPDRQACGRRSSASARRSTRFFRWLFGELQGSCQSAGGAALPTAGCTGACIVCWLRRAGAWLVCCGATASVAPAKPQTARGRALERPAGRRGSDRRPACPKRVGSNSPNAACANGNLRLALRAFYLANLAWLGRREFITIHAGKTNREYEIEMRRRTRAHRRRRADSSPRMSRPSSAPGTACTTSPAGDIDEFRQRMRRDEDGLAPEGVAA